MSREQRARRQRRLRGARGLAVLVLAAMCALWTAPRAAADGPAFTVGADGVGAVTGIAADSATQTYWVTGAASGQGSVQAISSSGKQKGGIGFRADVHSVQALAYHAGRLYVGDIGDSNLDRDLITVYYFDDVRPGDGVITYHSWDFRYPDGHHDAQAMVVDGTGRLYVITTGSDAGIYAAPEQPSRQGVNDLTRVADAPSGDITDAVALDADRWAVRTKDAVQIIDPSGYAVTAGAALPVSDGQALGLPLSGSSLLAVDGGTSPDVVSLGVPTTMAPATQTASPTPTPTTTPSADEQPTGDQEHTGAERRTGTWVALGLAAALAVLAGLTVVVVGGRRTPGPESDDTDDTDKQQPEEEPTRDPGSPVTPDRAAHGAAHFAGFADPDDTIRPARRAREPGDIEDDEDEATGEPDDEEADQTMLRGRLPRRGGDDTIRRPPRPS